MPLNEISYPIGLFSVPHIIFLAVLWPLAAILAILFSRKFGYNKKLIWVCAIIGLLCEVEKIFFFIEETPGGYRLPAEHIPINMCPFQIFLIFALALSEFPQKRKALLSFMYPTMVGGGFIGMLIPSVVVLGYHGLTEFSTYRYFFFHTMLIFLGLYLYFSKPVQYSIKSFGTAVAGICMVVVLAVWINAFFGWDPSVNFWFIVRPPADNLPLLNLDRGWPFYILQLMWICMLLFVLCYIREIIKSINKLIKKTR